MRKAKYVIPVLLAAIVGIGGTGCMLHRGAPPRELTLYFHPCVGPEPLIFNDARYPNPGGEGRFKVRDFQFFLSNIRLVGASGTYAEPDSYHLVRFDSAEPGFAIVLRGVPRRDYERIEFGIGVDAAANKSLAQRGDLDPNGRMAWTWEVGYKFVLFEGALVRGDASAALVYHVGFNENYTLVSTELNGDPLDNDTGRLDFRVDILRLFQGAATIDMAALPAVKFDHADAALLARNFAGMITPMKSDAVGHTVTRQGACPPTGTARGVPPWRACLGRVSSSPTWLNRRRPWAGLVRLVLFVGNIPPSDRFIWTVIGETVNLAARLQSMTRHLNAAVATDDTTFHRAGRETSAAFVRHADLAIRRRAQPETVHALPL